MSKGISKVLFCFVFSEKGIVNLCGQILKILDIFKRRSVCMYVYL